MIETLRRAKLYYLRDRAGKAAKVKGEGLNKKRALRISQGNIYIL